MIAVIRLGIDGKNKQTWAGGMTNETLRTLVLTQQARGGPKEYTRRGGGSGRRASTWPISVPVHGLPHAAVFTLTWIRALPTILICDPLDLVESRRVASRFY